MIKQADTIRAGQLGKPHGIKGELKASAAFDGWSPDSARCLIVEVDGILVPFFVASCRPQGRESWLLKFDGIDSEVQAKMLANHDYYVMADEAPARDGDDDSDGFYAEDLVGFTACTLGGELIGKIVDIDDATDNVLFIITRPDGSEALVPVADEFIDEIDDAGHRLILELPEGLLEQ